MRVRPLFTFLSLAAFPGCSAGDGVTGLDVAHDAVSTAAAIPEAAGAEHVAQGIAMALEDPAARAHLRTAMRDSRWTDHKLDLHAYVATRHGQAMVALAAARLGLPRTMLDTAIARLPAMDFYLPFREHRVAWRGSPGVMVAVSFAPDAQLLPAYRSDGSGVTLQLLDGSPDEVLLILHPAEPRGVRETSDTGSGRETVEDPHDPGIALMPCSPEPYAAGTTSDCEGSTPGTGGGGWTPTTTPGVYVTRFYSFRGDGWWGSVEMEFRSFGYSGIPQYSGFWFVPYSCAVGTAARSFEWKRQYDNLLLPLSPHVASVFSVSCRTSSGYPFTGGYYVRAVEMDGGLNLNDDDFGIRFFAGGTIPFGARMSSDEAYFSAGGYPYDSNRWDNTGAGELSVAMTLQYR